MQMLDDVVQETVNDFVSRNLLFTGLDVSNKVKESFPFARHSEVSDLVRQSFTSAMDPYGYAKTPINVSLKDGSVRTALLYHPLSDAWDLDSKYDDQKRSQSVVKLSTAPVAASVSANGAVTITTPTSVPLPASVPPGAAWAQMFNSQPSLFPLK